MRVPSIYHLIYLHLPLRSSYYFVYQQSLLLFVSLRQRRHAVMFTFRERSLGQGRPSVINK